MDAVIAQNCYSFRLDGVMGICNYEVWIILILYMVGFSLSRKCIIFGLYMLQLRILNEHLPPSDKALMAEGLLEHLCQLDMVVLV